MSIHSEAQLNVKFVQMAKLMNIYLNHFPNHEKYALSQQIRNCMYDLYKLIVECQKRYFKKTTLKDVDVTHEQLRMFVNLANSFGYFSFKNTKRDSAKDGVKRFLAISRVIDEIGRMIGGWIKSTQQSQERELSKNV